MVATSLQSPLGAIPQDKGVLFRVWAPFAEKVSVVGSFNQWSKEADPMQRDSRGNWSVEVGHARPGDEYKYWIKNGEKELLKNDPRARLINNESKNSVVYRSDFDWGDHSFQAPALNELAIYELHVGTFNTSGGGRAGRFDHVIRMLPYLQKLGINAIELMPLAEFPSGLSWGYNLTNPFAVEQSYGGPDGLKKLVKASHEHGIAVIVDVVYNHFGPDDLDLWQFDGWSENNRGGIYFYNDHRAWTPWGENRPDYGREEVRQYIRDNVLFWLGEFRLDGLRFDAVSYIRDTRGNNLDPGTEIAAGWSLLQWLNDEIQKYFPGKITIAEDLQSNPWIVKETQHGGAGFSSQWDPAFVHPTRIAVIVPEDSQRDLADICRALENTYENDKFKRVIYSESHDEVANGKARIPQEISPSDPAGYFAQRRSTLAAGLVFTAPGIPMIFSGQEFLEDEWFRDDKPIDWSKLEAYRGIQRLYRDLIHLRRNLGGVTRGLTGSGLHIHHVDNAKKVIAFRRWLKTGPADETLVVANFSNNTLENYEVGIPSSGTWKIRFNSDAKVYSEEFNDGGYHEVQAVSDPYDGLNHRGKFNLGPYSLMILSQDAPH